MPLGMPLRFAQGDSVRVRLGLIEPMELRIEPHLQHLRPLLSYCQKYPCRH